MIVTMIAVNMMEMTIHQIVDVIAVRDWFVTTARSMNMAFFVTTATMVGVYRHLDWFLKRRWRARRNDRHERGVGGHHADNRRAHRAR